jgi:glycosyltransferase involved in cell wall biosynthesis
MKVTILDMQPIDPAIGGGRLRLLGLYHALGDDIHATYVGTYDWPGPGYRRHMLSSTLEEIDVPLSEAHFAAAEAAMERTGGRNVIDCVFHKQAHLSPDFVVQARESAIAADVVIFSHPWIYPLVRDVLQPKRQLIVYDSHNVEGVLRTQLLDDGAGGSEVARGVVEVEKELCDAADLVLACSHGDRLQFMRIYDVAAEKIKLIPNGVFVGGITPAGETARRLVRKRLGMTERITAMFLGSAYGPNLDAANFIARELAPYCQTIDFVIAGGVGEPLLHEFGREKPDNLIITGLIDEEEKRNYLAASDIALNPMFGGSGTNIKMFDFMAAGLPIITTPIGARGIETRERAFIKSERQAFAGMLRALASDKQWRMKLGGDARTEVERYYAWERISETLGSLLKRRGAKKSAGAKAPYFSVVIPTFARPAELTRLLDLLASQTERDFEVVIVDQSEQAWTGLGLRFDIDVLYARSPIRGAVSARNLGALLSRGEVLAFVDDDCEPCADWLKAAREALADPDVVGVEGLVESSKRNASEWRAVTNKGFSGIGFMTANLLVRARAFVELNGFDVAFEEPHFREDTDFGWRLQRLGKVPFSEDAWVYHPPHRRDIQREAQSTRDRFFEKDALLLQKHPSRYLELFHGEGHWAHTPGFWPNFLRGAEKYQVKLPPDILQYAIDAKFDASNAPHETNVFSVRRQPL